MPNPVSRCVSACRCGHAVIGIRLDRRSAGWRSPPEPPRRAYRRRSRPLWQARAGSSGSFRARSAGPDRDDGARAAECARPLSGLRSTVPTSLARSAMNRSMPSAAERRHRGAQEARVGRQLGQPQVVQSGSGAELHHGQLIHKHARPVDRRLEPVIVQRGDQLQIAKPFDHQPVVEETIRLYARHRDVIGFSSSCSSKSARLCRR